MVARRYISPQEMVESNCIKESFLKSTFTQSSMVRACGWTRSSHKSFSYWICGDLDLPDHKLQLIKAKLKETGQYHGP